MTQQDQTQLRAVIKRWRKEADESDEQADRLDHVEFRKSAEAHRGRAKLTRRLAEELEIALREGDAPLTETTTDMNGRLHQFPCGHFVSRIRLADGTYLPIVGSEEKCLPCRELDRLRARVAELEDDEDAVTRREDCYIPERDGRRCVEHPRGDHELVCLTCMEAGEAAGERDAALKVAASGSQGEGGNSPLTPLPGAAAIRKRDAAALTCKHCGHDPSSPFTASVAVDQPGRPVSTVCTLMGCQHEAAEAPVRLPLSQKDDEDVARQRATDVRGATGSPRSPQPKGSER